MLPDLLGKSTIKLILWFWKNCRYCNGRCAETEVFTFVRACEAAALPAQEYLNFLQTFTWGLSWGRKRAQGESLLPVGRLAKPLLLNWLADTCIFSLNLFPVNEAIMAFKVLLLFGVQYYQDQYSVIFNIFSTSYCTIWKWIKMLGQGFCAVKVWYDWFGQSFLLDLCQKWAPRRSLSDFKFTKPGCTQHKQEEWSFDERKRKVAG